jgi:NADH-quinone oxidoreductase subunit L
LAALAWLVPALPLFAYGLFVFVGRRAGERAALFGVVALAGSTACSVALLVLAAQGHTVATSVPWLTLGTVHLRMGLYVGPLQAAMVTMVSFVSWLIEIYSIGYMHGDSRYNRFFANVTLFVTGMLTAVLADNLILFFMAWEIMGLCSYLLIGHWYEDMANARAATKAFLVTRVGDAGLLLGIWWAYSLTGTFSFARLPAALAALHLPVATLDAIALLIFLGAVGKSAQIPLQIWLPDAMAGPTPISALIHAATMVAAGVYLVVRTYGVFQLAPEALYVVGLVGSLSAFVPATIACVQTDIKKVLAYSTISQLGYMMMALGVGTAEGGIFHLLTHAFFKALLFLGSGSVIHAVGTQNLHEMGGLWRKQRLTAVTFIVGSLALAAIWPLSGYFSKDAILSTAYATRHYLFFWLGTVAAGLTAYYMTRLNVLAFFGAPRDEHRHAHAHESPAVMTAPLVVLAVPAAALGVAAAPLRRLLAALPGATPVPEVGWIGHLPLALAVLGFLAGLALYTRPVAVRARLLRWPVVRQAYGLCKELWYFDHAGLAVMYVLGLGPSFVVGAFDRYVVDGLVNGAATLSLWFGRLWRRLSTGNAQAYMLTLAVAAAIGLIALQLAAGG